MESELVSAWMLKSNNQIILAAEIIWGLIYA